MPNNNLNPGIWRRQSGPRSVPAKVVKTIRAEARPAPLGNL